MCTDGSPSAQEAIRFGGLIARFMQADVTVLAVSASAEAAARTAEILHRCEPLLKESGIRPRTVSRAGLPAEEIIREAEENGYDLVVIGAYGVRGLTRFVLGSTAYQIVGHMPVDTLVVRGKRPGLRQVLICTAAQADERAIEVGGGWTRAAGASVTLLQDRQARRPARACRPD
jgi:nucleotide-binding universal stress UspA family protein